MPLTAVSTINYSSIDWAEAGNTLTSIVIQARNYGARGGFKSKMGINRTKTEGPGLKFTFQRYQLSVTLLGMTSPRSGLSQKGG